MFQCGKLDVIQWMVENTVIRDRLFTREGERSLLHAAAKYGQVSSTTPAQRPTSLTAPTVQSLHTVTKFQRLTDDCRPAKCIACRRDTVQGGSRCTFSARAGSYPALYRSRTN